MVGDRRGRWADAPDDPRIYAPGLGIYAAPGGGGHSLHALHHAGNFHRRSPKSAPGHGSHYQGLSRSGPGPGQGRPGRDLNGPGPGVHAGNVDYPEAQIAVAAASDPGGTHRPDE